MKASLHSVSTLPRPVNPEESLRDRYLPVGLAALACLVTTTVLWPLANAIDLANIVMLYLLVVVLVARFLGRIASIAAAVLSVALFDFFFVPPQLSFAVEDVQYLVTFAVMLIVALVVAELVSEVKARAQRAAKIAAEQTALYDLAYQLAGTMTVASAVGKAKQFANQHLSSRLAVLMPSPEANRGKLLLVCSDDNTDTLPAVAYAAAEAAYASERAINSFELGNDHAERLLLPIEGSTRRRGVVLLTAIGNESPRTHEALARALTALLATAVERIHYVEVAQASDIELKSQQLRSGLLAALSHDIRTPLTAIYGLADTLVADQTVTSPGARDSATAIRDQASNLSRMVSNLLELARIRSGRVSLQREWQPIDEVIGASVRFVQSVLANRMVNVRIEQAAAWVDIDAVAMERVLCNLLENANKYAAPDTPIEIDASVDEAARHLLLRVENKGAPIAEAERDRMFEIFERGGTTSHADGLGIGLAICKALVEAHGGTIEVANTRDGVSFNVRVPVGTTPQIDWPTAEPEPGRQA